VTPPAAAAAPAVRPTPRRSTDRRPAVAQPRSRRVSGPARPVRRTTAPRFERPASSESGLGEGSLIGALLAALQSVSRHRLLGRLLSGRTWIGLLAFALIGIVTLQLGLLELNSGIGRALEREALLQRENASLSIEDSELAAGDRVESQATRLGMELVPMGALRFLTARSGADAARASAALSAPAKAPSTSTSTSETAATTETSSAAAASGEQPSGSASSSQSAAQAAGTPTGEAGAPAGETTPPSSNASPAPAVAATGAAQTQPSVASSAPAAASTEASPAGGTQAGSSG
jgi:hypothetical protein